MQTVPLDKNRHNRRAFDCGVEALNNYLKVMANQQALKDNSRTYILEDSNNSHAIVGYYTLSMTSIDLSLLPKNLQKKHQNNNTAGLIARLAVDKKYTQKGLGAWLLIDALKKLLHASKSVAFPMIVVDAKEGVSSFYEQFGFAPFKDEERKLFISLADVRASFNA